MAKKTRTFNNVAVSIKQGNPTHSSSIIAPRTATEVECLMTASRGTWASMLGRGILTMAVQQKLNNKWVNVVQSTFEAQSTNFDGKALFSSRVGGLGGKTLRLSGWCTIPINIKAIITLIF